MTQRAHHLNIDLQPVLPGQTHTAYTKTFGQNDLMLFNLNGASISEMMVGRYKGIEQGVPVFTASGDKAAKRRRFTHYALAKWGQIS